MSVELIVYPQSYEGEYNAISSSANELFVDGIGFNLVNGSSTSLVPSIPNIIEITLASLYLTVVPNAWYRYYTTGTAQVFQNSVGMNFIPSVVGQIGIIQMLTNVIVGVSYNITISSNINGNPVTVQIYEQPSPGAPPTLQSSQQISPVGGSGVVVLPFTPTTAFPFLVFDLVGDATSNSLIQNISVTPIGVSPTEINFELADGQIICDLYEDEDIPLTLSVDNFKNAAEKVQSYSKAFKLPATKRNNLIFDNMFEITRSDDDIIFNPYKRTQCVLKQEGFILFKGYLRLIDISTKNGEVSYNVNLYSQVVALKDYLKDKTFSLLDFTELNHAYNKTNIQNSAKDAGTGIAYFNSGTSGYRDAYTTLRYPFVDWAHTFIVSDGTLGNINNPQLTKLEQAFRPFINLKYIVNRIFQDSPFSWKSDFFDGSLFEDLYMDFNWGKDDYPSAGDTEGIVTKLLDQETPNGDTDILWDEMPGQAPLSSDFGYDSTTGIFTAQQTGQAYEFAFNISGYQTSYTFGDYWRIRWLINGTMIESEGNFFANQAYGWTGTFSTGELQAGDEVQVKTYINISAGTAYISNNVTATIAGPSITITTNPNNTTSETLLQGARGELKQWDFLKGLITMFNLVTMPDEDNPSIIRIEPYRDIFQIYTNSDDITDMTLASRNIQHDWTDKIDIEEIKLKPLTDLKKTTLFQFKEDEDDFPFTNYKTQVGGHLYGSKVFDATLASNGLATIFQGEDKITAEPFAATVIKPLMSQYPDLIVPSLYSMSDDETEGFNNSPRIMFNNGIKDISPLTYYIPAQNGLLSANWDEYLQFGHINSIPTQSTTIDVHFGNCQLIPPAGTGTLNNLYSLYWAPYYNELYHPDTRIMTIKINLSPSDINLFKFDDTVIIQNREFRVNKIDYKPNDLATVELILIP